MNAPKQTRNIVPILAALLAVAVAVIVFLVVTQSKAPEAAAPKTSEAVQTSAKEEPKAEESKAETSKAEEPKVEVAKVEVPDVLYVTRTEAEAALITAGLKVGTISEQEYLIGGYVLESDPAVGTTVDEGTPVNLVVSVGQDVNAPVTVPDLTGKTPEEAESALLALNLIPQPGQQSYSDTVEPGRVCAQSIAAGSNVSMFDAVTYSTSIGRELVRVPNVTGMSVAQARDTLNKSGLSCDTNTAYNDTVPKDTVIIQNVAEGTEVTKGTTVTIESSLGPRPPAKVVVPAILSYNLDEALRALESAGLKYTYTGDLDGTVIAVQPPINTQVDQGSTVTFELKRPQPVTPAVPEQPEQLEPRFTREECVERAVSVTGAGGQATGPANNLMATTLITGGGTLYYFVDYDLGEAHYRVQVDAIDGIVLSIIETIGNIENTYDGNMNLLSTVTL